MNIKEKIEWPKKPTKWIENEILFVSVPFTWNLPELRFELQQQDLEWRYAVIGGPAIRLMPDYLADLPWVTIDRDDMPGVLQRVHPLATKTSIGCPNKCGFCAVPKTEPKFIELEDWPDLPLICDNNLLACSEKHFDKVMDRLEKWEEVDFNQGLDKRFLTEHHIERFKRLKKPILRFACDTNLELEKWNEVVEMCFSFKIPKRWIKTYALIGWKDTPEDAWNRCNAIEKVIKSSSSPMWFHGLEQFEPNIVTNAQEKKGWTDQERQDIMGFFYQHRGKRKYEN